MRHPAEGVLRRLLDEPSGVTAVDRRHVSDCPRCLDRLAGVRRDADLVAAALTVEGDDEVDAAAAWQRLSSDLTTRSPARPAATPRTGRVHDLLRRPAAAGLAVAVVLAGAGTAAGNDWLQVFQTEQVAPVRFATSDLVALPDLAAYGDLRLVEEPAVHEVADAAAAQQQTGLDVPDVEELPRGVAGDPVVQVGGRASATFTFSSARAEQAAADAGEQAPSSPPGLDGTVVRLTAGPGVLQLWRSEAGAPALVVGRAVAPTAASSSGVPFAQLRDHLLSLPGLPPELAEQLQALTADGSTLPLPVPADEVTTRAVEVDGVPATLLETRDGALAGVVWVEDGELTVVAGSLDDDEVLAVARDLR